MPVWSESIDNQNSWFQRGTRQDSREYWKLYMFQTEVCYSMDTAIQLKDVGAAGKMTFKKPEAKMCYDCYEKT